MCLPLRVDPEQTTLYRSSCGSGSLLLWVAETPEIVSNVGETSMPNLRQSPFLLAVVSAALVVGVAGQGLPGEALSNLIRANERFGRILLERLHSTNPGRNVAVSPISVSIILAAIQTNADGSDTRKEIGEALGWEDTPNLTVPSRMLLVALDKRTHHRFSPGGRRRRGCSLRCPKRPGCRTQFSTAGETHFLSGSSAAPRGTSE